MEMGKQRSAAICRFFKQWEFRELRWPDQRVPKQFLVWPTQYRADAILSGIQGLREKFFLGIQRSIPGPQIFLGTLFFLIFCPNLSEEQKKRSSLKFSPIFFPKFR